MVKEMPWRLNPHDHACLLYRCWEDQRSVLDGYFAQGIKQNQRCIYLYDETDPQQILESLSLRPSDYERQNATGLFTPSKYDSLLVKTIWHRLVSQSLLKGYRGLRVAVEMSWASSLSIPEILDFERAIARVAKAKPLVCICLYNTYKAPMNLVNFLQKTHPQIFIGSQLTLLPFVTGDQKWAVKERQL
jgi:hypothetical protein